MTESTRTVLFDIDGTLLRCGPQIRWIFQSALEETFGTSGPIDSYDFAGRTDYGIVHDLLGAAGLEASSVTERLPEFEELYLERLEARLDPDKMTLLPGVTRLLDGLEATETVFVGLLTGNTERGAMIKLSRLGLERYFGFGAYGDRVADRSDLPPVALRRARRHHDHAGEAGRAVIIGDSVLDVRCARAHGIRCLAVATGFAPREELAAAGADRVVDDLTEIDPHRDLLPQVI